MRWSNSGSDRGFVQGLLRGDFSDGDTVVISAGDDGLVIWAEGAGAPFAVPAPPGAVGASVIDPASAHIDPDEAEGTGLKS